MQYRYYDTIEDQQHCNHLNGVVINHAPCEFYSFAMHFNSRGVFHPLPMPFLLLSLHILCSIDCMHYNGKLHLEQTSKALNYNCSIAVDWLAAFRAALTNNKTY